ncbi:XP_029645013.1uncharacterized protein LOC115219087 isoform X1 [Octopus vulgaris]|uniref:XP_029645013.1uncharacterized protein LOC115219087 isoform X1 n=1 Tax=Octopus vulgaris TaxID=6645 RepID=A0AA36BFW3_OCTVU|nr:XP_029645013.1uncharacterized protein LOC115219087 isoform X1 [Octopus vulgaris]
MGIVFITHEDVKSVSRQTPWRLLAGDKPWRILSPAKEGNNMGFSLNFHEMYQNQTNTMPDVVDHHGNKQALTSGSNFLDSEMNNSIVGTKKSTGVCAEPAANVPSKLTWKDLSPTKQKNLSPHSSSSSGGSSGEENPASGVIWGEDSEVNKNQLVTWKQLSPTKLSPPIDYEPDSGYSSNEVNHKIKGTTELCNSYIMATQQKPMKTSSGSTSNESPEDALEYFYDEDFSVQFEPNLSNPQINLDDIGRDEMFILPQMLNGSYLSFESLKSSSDATPAPFEDQCELEFSDNQNSMEISTSERDMMCSSEMLELSSDPLFTPTPTSEAPPCHLLNDSLDHGHKPGDLQISKSSMDPNQSVDGKLVIDCYPRKENYCLSFVGSQSKTSSSEAEISLTPLRTHESDDNESGVHHYCTSSGEGAEDVFANSFHYCRDGEVSAKCPPLLRLLRSDTTAKTRFVGQLTSLPETNQEAENESTSSGMSECSGQGRIISHSLPRNGCSMQTFSSLKNKVGSHSRPKTMVSWKQIKTMYRKGKQLSNQNSGGKSCSMPDLCLRTWQKVAAEKKKGLESSKEEEEEEEEEEEDDEKAENKRYSATLVELYQRMKAMGKASSPDIHIPGWSLNSSTSSRPGSGQWSVNSDDKLYINDMKGADGIHLAIQCEQTGWENSSHLDHHHHHHINSAQDVKDCIDCREGFSSFELRSACCQVPLNRKRTQATAISPQSVNVWLGTKNFSAQFPPLTRDCGVQTSFEDERSMASGLRRNCKQTSEGSYDIPKCHCHMMAKSERTKTREAFHMSTRIAREVFYSHRSLPDLSFITLPSPSLQRLQRRSTDKPVLINPRIHRPNTNSNAPPNTNFKETLEELKKLQRPEAMHISGPFCSRRSGMFRPIGACRGADWHSSSSGFSTSSTSSGIDPGCFDYWYGSFGSFPRLPCCAALLDTRYVYNSAGFETFPRIVRQPEEKTQAKTRAVDRRYERYQYESHPAHNRQKPWKRWSASTSSNSSGNSAQAETLYSVAEEKTPTSPEKSLEGKLEENEEYGDCRLGTDGYYDNQVFDEKQEGLEDAVQCVRMRNTGLTLAETYCPDKRPLKSCLRKRQRSLSDPYAKAPWTDNIKKHNTAATTHRHSYGCDRDQMAGADGPIDYPKDFDAVAASSPVEVLPSGDCGSDSVSANPTRDVILNETSNTSLSEKDMARSKKSVSFAREVSFHSPPCSPQVPPRRQSLEGRQVPHNGYSLTKDSVSSPNWMGVTSNQPTFPVPRDIHNQNQNSAEGTFGKDKGSEDRDQPPTPPRSMGKKELEKKSAMLAEVSKAAEALVDHFSKSKDPFDKLRLGSSVETPEIGDLVLSRLCPAVAQVINNGLKSYESGLHVFGRVHITVWRVAEASAEPGPSTRAICDIVKELRNRPNLSSNKHRFDAFIFALLNSRLLDFWLGYLRHRDNVICHFYNNNALLQQQLYISDLGDAYEEMLLSLQPLSVLPFQLDLDFVCGSGGQNQASGEMTQSREGGATLSEPSAGSLSVESMKLSSPSVRYEEASEENALGQSAAKAWKWLSSSTANALPKAKSVVANVAQKVSPSISRLGTSLSKATLGDSSEYKVTEDILNMDQLADSLPLSNDDTESVSSTSNSTLLGSNVESPLEVKSVTEMERIDESKTSTCSKDSKNTDNEKQSQSLLDELFPDASETSDLEQSTSLSVSNIAQKFLGIGTSKRKQPYRKELTEYSFDSEPDSSNSIKESHSDTSLKNEESSKKGTSSNKASESLVQEVLDKYCEANPSKSETNELKSDNKNSFNNSSGPKSSMPKLESQPSANSFDIIKLFDKLLLPNKSSKTPESKANVEGGAAYRNTPTISAFNLFPWGQPNPTSDDLKSPNSKQERTHSNTTDRSSDQNQNAAETTNIKAENKEVSKTAEPAPVLAENKSGNSADPFATGSSALYEWCDMAKPQDPSQDPSEDHCDLPLDSTASLPSDSPASPQDYFRMPDYRYVRTLYASSHDCTAGIDGVLDFAAGDELEVLAQLDKSWLFCANGHLEGIVHIQWVKPLDDQLVFETLHDNFYR